MFLLSCLLATACIFGTPSTQLETIQNEIADLWRIGGPARNLRVKCRFDLKIERPDTALGDQYFPNSLIPELKRSGPRFRARPQTKWVEDYATRGQKYRYDHEFFHPDAKDTPLGPRVETFFNGTNSWSFNTLKSVAIQYQGSALTTKLTLGYYPDMIGFPGTPLAKGRTTASGAGEAYQLDMLIPSGKYVMDKEETVDGIDCVVLFRSGLDRLWLAKENGWSIVRRDWNWSQGGPPKRRVRNRDFRVITGGAWIPFDATMEIYGHPDTLPGQRVGTLHAAVLEAEGDVPDDWFEPHFPRGAIVDDVASGNRYPFGMELEELDSSVANASRFGPMFRPAPWWERKIWWAVGAAVLLLATAGRRYRLSRRESR